MIYDTLKIHAYLCKDILGNSYKKYTLNYKLFFFNNNEITKDLHFYNKILKVFYEN